MLWTIRGTMHPRRTVTAIVVALVIGLVQAAGAQTRPLKKIRVGVPSVSMGNIIIFVTKEARLFEKYGLDAEVITMNGSGIASKALISGNIEISPIATPTVISANLAGSDMAILAHTMPGVVHALMVKPEIKSPEDLKGKKIAVSSLGSLTDFLVRYIARKKGLNPDRELTLIQTGGDAERIVALKSGVVDGAAMSHPGYGRAQRMGFSMLWDSAKEVNYPWMEITTRKATIRNDRETVMNYVRAHLEGIALFKRDREFGKRVIKKTLRLDDEELVNESYEIFSNAFIPAPYPNLQGMKTSFEYVAMTRPEVWKHKPEEFADSSFVAELDKSGFIRKLYEK
ncbi:MAG TPA: ABC transporter substrate-binding protein [Candidatus Eisenbacteria bacterium]|nr:ABC transporter substrate-binding protein [Candidatus Eisenbacteria bacterium]